MEKPLKLIIVGFALLLAGVVLPFMMINQMLESTLALNFIAYGCSTAGLITGFVGIAQYTRFRR